MTPMQAPLFGATQLPATVWIVYVTGAITNRDWPARVFLHERDARDFADVLRDQWPNVACTEHPFEQGDARDSLLWHVQQEASPQGEPAALLPFCVDPTGTPIGVVRQSRDHTPWLVVLLRARDRLTAETLAAPLFAAYLDEAARVTP